MKIPAADVDTREEQDDESNEKQDAPAGRKLHHDCSEEPADQAPEPPAARFLFVLCGFQFFRVELIAGGCVGAELLQSCCIAMPSLIRCQKLWSLPAIGSVRL